MTEERKAVWEWMLFPEGLPKESTEILVWNDYKKRVEFVNFEANQKAPYRLIMDCCGCYIHEYYVTHWAYPPKGPNKRVNKND